MHLLLLCYHGVGSRWPSDLAVPEHVLHGQLALLRERGYVGLTFADLERRRLDASAPRRAVVVMFDDGYASTLRARPILRELGFPATVFVVTSFLDSGEPLRWPGIEGWADTEYVDELRPLAWSDLEGLAEEGWEVGSHTVTHPCLPEVDDTALFFELAESRAAIAARLGSCETLCYPYGAVDDRVASEAERAGYLAACGPTAYARGDRRYARARVGLYPCDRGVRLRLKVSPLVAGLRRTIAADAAQRVRLWLRSRSPQPLQGN